MGKSTISMAIFNSFLLVYQRVATITSRFVFFFDRHMSFTSEVQAVGALLPTAATSPEWPDVARVGSTGYRKSWEKHLGIVREITISDDISWDKNLEIWETTWRFLVNFQFHEFFCKTAQDCGMQPGKTFLDVPRWEFFRPPRGAGVCHSFDCSFWDSSRTIKAT